MEKKDLFKLTKQLSTDYEQINGIKFTVNRF
jgi:hypothetical protein